jgi:hypothetical protein
MKFSIVPCVNNHNCGVILDDNDRRLVEYSGRRDPIYAYRMTRDSTFNVDLSYVEGVAIGHARFCEVADILTALPEPIRMPLTWNGHEWVRLSSEVEV